MDDFSTLTLFFRFEGWRNKTVRLLLGLLE